MKQAKQVKIIHAQPGWQGVAPIFDGNGIVDGLHKEPIIAWCIKAEFMPDMNDSLLAEPVPITAEGVAGRNEYKIFERPGGTLTYAEAQEFNGEADIIKYFQEEEEGK